jgi:hypothetical protein
MRVCVVGVDGLCVHVTDYTRLSALGRDIAKLLIVM